MWCSSVVRHFRYAATMTACQLVSSWIRTMQTLNEARDTAQRQLDAESKKKSNKVGSAGALCTWRFAAHLLAGVILKCNI